jgi:broad specificity phosphatase PhoE
LLAFLVLYFARHGESQANVDQVFAGINRPAPLTEVGRQQALLAARGILEMNIRIDGIVFSPLERASETAEIISDSLGMDSASISFDARLIEYDVGTLAGRPTQGVTPAQLVGTIGGRVTANRGCPVFSRRRAWRPLPEVRGEPSRSPFP